VVRFAAGAPPTFLDACCATPVGDCIEDDLGCTSDTDCCSGVCGTDSLCGYPPPADIVTCAVDDQACKMDADCCSFLCASDGFCGLPGGSCNVDNDPCQVDSDCCSNVCAPDGYCGL
jgi:hypothetical protein